MTFTAGAENVPVFSDTGKALPPGFDPAAPGQGLGIKIVGMLNRQVKGVLTVGTTPQAALTSSWTFPAL